MELKASSGLILFCLCKNKLKGGIFTFLLNLSVQKFLTKKKDKIVKQILGLC